MSVMHEDLNANTTDVQSPSGLWSDCPVEKIVKDPSVGWLKHEDFISAAPEDALSSGGVIIGDAGAWKAVTTASGTEMAASTTSATGEIIVSGHTDDNDENYLGFGDGVAGPIDFTVTTGKEFWFEACLKHSALTNSFFIGLAKPADIAAAVLTDNTGVVKDTDYVGFGANYTDGKTTLYARIKKVSVTAVTVDSDVGTITADTFYRVGLKYKGGVLSFYVNGSLVASRTVLSTDITSGVQLTPMFAEINDAAGAAVTHNIDWVRFAQVR